MPQREARVRALLEWADRIGPTAPAGEDLVVLGCLGLTNEHAAHRLLWRDASALFERWPELQLILSDPTAAERDVAPAAPVAVATEVSVPDAGVPDAGVRNVSVPAAPDRPLRDDRLSRLLRWRDTSSATRPELQAIDDADLAALAEATLGAPSDILELSPRLSASSQVAAAADDIFAILHQHGDDPQPNPVAGAASAEVPPDATAGTATGPSLPADSPPDDAGLARPAAPASTSSGSATEGQQSDLGTTDGPASPLQSSSEQPSAPTSASEGVAGEPAPAAPASGAVERTEAPTPDAQQKEPAVTSPATTESDWLTTARPFAPYDWSRHEKVEPSTVPVMQTSVIDGKAQLHWRRNEAEGAVVYRVVQSDQEWPVFGPERIGEDVGVTERTSVCADLWSGAAVTYLAVWAYVDVDGRGVWDAHPSLWTLGEVIWPPTDLEMNADQRDEVTARFKIPAGVERVEVHRKVTPNAPNQQTPPAYDSSRRLLEPEAEIYNTGFVDRKAPFSGYMTYSVYCLADIDRGGGNVTYRPSSPAWATVHRVAEPVKLDLTVVPNPEAGYDLSWPDPGFGDVNVYLTDLKPPEGLFDTARHVDAIVRSGLTPERIIRRPIVRDGTRQRLTRIRIDETWVRAYFVAAHSTGAEAIRLSDSVEIVKPRAPELIQVTERVDSQIITFAWPQGIKIVELYQGPRNATDFDPLSSQMVDSITDVDYLRLGGLHVFPHLPANGCTLHLFGVLYERGQPRRSVAATCDYAGMTRVWYQLSPIWPETGPDTRGGAPTAYRLIVRSDEVLTNAPFCVVQHPHRLPLHPQDGRLVHNVEQSIPRGVDISLLTLPAGQTRGYARLFFNTHDPREAARVAVMDPPTRSLNLELSP